MLSPIKDGLQQLGAGCDERLVQAPLGDVSKLQCFTCSYSVLCNVLGCQVFWPTVRGKERLFRHASASVSLLDRLALVWLVMPIKEKMYGALSNQCSSHVGAGICSLRGALVTLPTCETVQFQKFFVSEMHSSHWWRLVHLLLLNGYQGGC